MIDKLDLSAFDGLSQEQLCHLILIYRAMLEDMIKINNGFTNAQEQANKLWTAQVNLRGAQMQAEITALTSRPRGQERPPDTQLN